MQCDALRRRVCFTACITAFLVQLRRGQRQKREEERAETATLTAELNSLRRDHEEVLRRRCEARQAAVQQSVISAETSQRQSISCLAADEWHLLSADLLHELHRVAAAEKRRAALLNLMELKEKDASDEAERLRGKNESHSTRRKRTRGRGAATAPGRAAASHFTGGMLDELDAVVLTASPARALPGRRVDARQEVFPPACSTPPKEQHLQTRCNTPSSAASATRPPAPKGYIALRRTTPCFVKEKRETDGATAVPEQLNSTAGVRPCQTGGGDAAAKTIATTVAAPCVAGSDDAFSTGQAVPPSPSPQPRHPLHCCSEGPAISAAVAALTSTSKRTLPVVQHAHVHHQANSRNKPVGTAATPTTTAPATRGNVSALPRGPRAKLHRPRLLLPSSSSWAGGGEDLFADLFT